MNIRGFILVFFFLSACGTNQNKQDDFVKQVNTKPSLKMDLSKNYQIEYQLYGKLEKVDSGFRFVQFSEGYVPTEPWVRLSDLKPMWSTDKEECTTGIVERTNKRVVCKTENDKFFREKSLDLAPKKAASYALLSVLSYGLWATMPPAEVEFNEKAYENALSDAVFSLDNRYKSSGSNYKEFIKNYNEEMKSYFSKISGIRSGYKNGRVAKINLEDNSGLFKGAKNLFQNHVKVRKNKISTVKMIRKGNDSYGFLEMIKNNNQRSIDGSIMLASTANVDCKENVYRYISYQIICPESIRSSQKEFDVNVVIDSINYLEVLPKKISSGDANIMAEMKGKLFHLTNKSNKFLTVDSISFYHNGKIASLSKLGYELAPFSSVKPFYLSKFPLDKSVLTFKRMTKAKAENIKLNFGLAVKYKIIDSDQEKTLFNQKQYLLADLI